MRSLFSRRGSSEPARPVRPSPAGDDLRIGVCAIARNERDYLLEWVAYQRLAGFDGIHVYDNVSDDGTSELLAALDAAGVVHRTHWPRRDGVPPQRHAYQHFLETAAGRYDWVLICDLDEFVVPRNGTLKDFLRRGLEMDPTVTAYALPWLVFGSGGQDEQRDGLVIERFTNCSANPGPSVKTLFRTDAVLSMRTHIADLMWGRYADNAYQSPRWSDRMPIDVVDAVDGEVLVHHYFTKSREEWTRRRQLPKADRAEVSHRNLTMFERYVDLPRDEHRAARMAGSVRAEIAELETLLARSGSARLEPVVVSMSRDGVIGTVKGRGATEDCVVRVVINEVVERVVTCDRVVDGRPGFFASAKWHEVPPKSARVSVVGSRRAVKAVSDGRRDQAEVLEAVQKALPSAEEKIVNIALELAKTEAGAGKLAKTLSTEFDKFPWYGALLEGIVALHRGDTRGRDVLADAARRWPHGMRQLAEKLREKDVRYALELLERHGVSTETFSAVPTTA